MLKISAEDKLFKSHTVSTVSRHTSTFMASHICLWSKFRDIWPSLPQLICEKKVIYLAISDLSRHPLSRSLPPLTHWCRRYVRGEREQLSLALVLNVKRPLTFKARAKVKKKGMVQ